MIKNIIFDVGGILFDDSKESITKLLGKDSTNIYKAAYGQDFKKCLLGQITVQEHLSNLKSKPDFNDIKFILTKEYLPRSYPLLEENFNYIKALKDKGYKLFLLTNITEDSYNYINETININSIFTGGIYSYQEHLIKPNPEIYELIIKRFNLKKNETIFFDDKEKNVKAAKETGLKSIVFTSLQDIKDNINFKN